MIASIFHRLEYTYDQEVSLGPQIIYLYPKPDRFCEMLEINLGVFPTPSKLSIHLDAEGNTQQIALFEEPTNYLNVELQAKIKLETLNPFDFYFVPKEAQKLPMKYDPEQKRVLGPYFMNETISAELMVLSNNLFSKVKAQTSAFLMEVNNYIFTEFTYEIREEGNANLPGYTLWQKRGSCRDFAVLFSAICQAQGLATRYASGYYVGHSPVQVPDQSHNLHAWVEVYLPGGGWCGYDPTQNEVVCGNHIALATSYDLNIIAPLSGYFCGDGQSRLHTKVDIKII